MQDSDNSQTTSAKSQLNYCIVMPVHNEETYILNALESIANQIHRPIELIIVNDNSTDATPELIQGFIGPHPYMKMVNSGTHSTEHQPGSKIVRAFYKGFEQLEKEWDVVVKLDADVILPTDYFEKILEKFATDSTIGIAGGLAYIQENGEWVYEPIGNKKQVRGPFKSYSKACFEQIGGLKTSIGWDTVDELLAQYHGFKIEVLPDLKVKLQKSTGKDYRAIHAQKTGQAFYRMDYGWMISGIAALKVAWNKKSAKSFFQITTAYFQSALKSDSKMVNRAEGKFIRKYRWKGILSKIF